MEWGDLLGWGALGLGAGGLLYNWLGNDEAEQLNQQRLNLLSNQNARANAYGDTAMSVPLTQYDVNNGYTAGNPIAFQSLAQPTPLDVTSSQYMTDALENYSAMNNALARGEQPEEWALGAQQLQNSAMRALAANRAGLQGSNQGSGHALRQSLNQDSANLLADMQRNNYQQQLAMRPTMMAQQGQLASADQQNQNALQRFNQDWMMKTNMANQAGTNVVNEANARRGWEVGDKNVARKDLIAKQPFEENIRKVSVASGIPTGADSYANALGGMANSSATQGNAMATMGAGMLGQMATNEDFTKKKFNLFGLIG